MSSPQREAQRAARDHGDDGQRQQPVPLQVTLRGTPEGLRPMEDSLHPIPHRPLGLSRSMRTVVPARLLLLLW